MFVVITRTITTWYVGKQKRNSARTWRAEIIDQAIVYKFFVANRFLFLSVNDNFTIDNRDNVPRERPSVDGNVPFRRNNTTAAEVVN